MPTMKVYKLLNYKTRAEAEAAARRERGHGTTAKIAKNGPLNYPYSVVFKKPVYAPRKKGKR